MPDCYGVAQRTENALLGRIDRERKEQREKTRKNLQDLSSLCRQTKEDEIRSWTPPNSPANKPLRQGRVPVISAKAEQGFEARIINGHRDFSRQPEFLNTPAKTEPMRPRGVPREFTLCNRDSHLKNR